MGGWEAAGWGSPRTGLGPAERPGEALLSCGYSPPTVSMGSQGPSPHQLSELGCTSATPTLAGGRGLPKGVQSWVSHFPYDPSLSLSLSCSVIPAPGPPTPLLFLSHLAGCPSPLSSWTRPVHAHMLPLSHVLTDIPPSAISAFLFPPTRVDLASTSTTY